MRRSRPRVSDGRHRQRMVDVAETEKASGRMSLGHDDILRWNRAFAAEIDALIPGRDAHKAALAEGATFEDALRQSADAADQGMRDTVPLVARKGRASYLGERSAGHQDPGATSSHLLLEAAAETWGRPGQAR